MAPTSPDRLPTRAGRQSPPRHPGRIGPAGPVPRRHRPAGGRAGPGRLDPGPSGRAGPGGGVPPVVLERAPRSRLPLAAGHGGLRGGQAGRAVLRGTRPGRRGCGHLLPEHHRGSQPPGLPAAPGSRRRGGDHRRRAPRQPPPLGACRHPTLRGVLGCRDLLRGGRVRGPGRGSDPAGAPGRDGGIQRHRMAPPDRRHRRSRAPARGAGGGGRGPVGRLTDPCRPPPTSWPSAGTSSTPPSGPGR